MDSDKANRIDFYQKDQPYGEFSNFYHSPIVLNGKTWNTVEHYFQGQKHIGTDTEEVVRNAETPGKAKKIARSKQYARQDWEEVKLDIMYEACKAKFTTYDDLKKLLLSTKDAYLSEHTKNDKFWGDGGDDSGQNHLGKTLMKVRDDISKDENIKEGDEKAN